MYTVPWFERQMQTDSRKNDRTVILKKNSKINQKSKNLKYT